MTEDAATSYPAHRIAVLGGGFIGSNVARQLAAVGHSVRVASRSHSDLADPSFGTVERCLVDAADRAALFAALDGVTHVIWAISSLMPGESDQDPERDMRLMMSTLLPTLDVVAARPGTTFVLVSSGGTVYGRPSVVPTPEHASTDPIGAYGITRLAAEKFALRHADLRHGPVRIARVANVYGPGQSANRGQGIVAAALDHVEAGTSMRMFGDGSVRRDFIHIADAAHYLAQYALASDAPSVLNVGSGTSVSIAEVVDLVRRITGEPLAVDHAPAREFDVPHVELDVTTLRSLFPGACIPLEVGIAATWSARVAARATATPAESVELAS